MPPREFTNSRAWSLSKISVQKPYRHHGQRNACSSEPLLRVPAATDGSLTNQRANATLGTGHSSFNNNFGVERFNVRHVVLYQLLSLDGVAETPDDFILHFDDVMEENLRQVISAQDTVLLGRNMYDEWSEYWPKSDDEPFSSFINGVAKYVVTSTPPLRSWSNTTVAQGSLAELVARLKRESGGDIGVHGSVALSRSLFALGLIDELRLVIAPSVIGAGRKLFEGTSPHRFEVVSNVTSPTGYLLVGLRSV